jgi:hypothetical protein
MRQSELEFIRQLGVQDTAVDHRLYAAHMFQPRVVGSILVLGVLQQSPWPFVLLSLALGWSALVPTRNPFDAVYNRVIARPPGLPLLEAAPIPKRFAAGMAGALMLGIGVALLLDSRPLAWALQGIAAAAVLTVVVGRFCEGAALYHLLVRAATRVLWPAGVAGPRG